MKKSFAYLLICLFSLAYSYETVGAFAKAVKSSVDISMDCEGENETESEENAEKYEKNEFYNNSISNLDLLMSDASKSHWRIVKKIGFISSDFSKGIDFPPEQA